MRLNFLSLPNLTLFVALALSGVAAYYSIIGLTAIFAGAIIPIIVMGAILEVAKLTTTVWLRTYWSKCKWLLKSYLVSSVIILALITSMGIFGFLSKAHIDQGIGTGDVAASIALIDEKIKTQRENIKSSRDALAQMDLQVNNVIIKGDTEKSAARSVQIRRQQAKERSTLQKEIEVANQVIGKLNEERAPIASQLRKVEAEVGPIKYVAALIYGDNTDSNTLEKAVRWVIILLVVVFDPLAIAMLLAANQSRDWIKEGKPIEKETPVEEPKHIEPETTDRAETTPELSADVLATQWPEIHTANLGTVGDDLVKSQKPPGGDFRKILYNNLDDLTDKKVSPESVTIQTEGVTTELPDPVPEYKELAAGYVSYQGKHMNKNVLRTLRPDLFTEAGNERQVIIGFGIKFPEGAHKGDVFVRVDVLPNQVYKFDGTKWIIVDKEQNESYLEDQEYIKFLVDKIYTREYDVELLSENERQQVEEYLNSQKQS